MLVKKLEAMAAAQPDAKLAVVVNFPGPPADASKETPKDPAPSKNETKAKIKKPVSSKVAAKVRSKKAAGSAEDELKEKIKKGDLSSDELKAIIKKYGEKQGFKKTPLALITEGELLKINNDAEITVMIYRGKKVRHNYALAGSLDQKTAAAILADTKKLLLEPAEKPKGKDEPTSKSKTPAKTK